MALVVVEALLAPDKDDDAVPAGPIELARSTDAEKQRQLQRLAGFQGRHADERPPRSTGSATPPSRATTCSLC
jgi:isobutyryl-CoA mutase